MKNKTHSPYWAEFKCRECCQKQTRSYFPMGDSPEEKRESFVIEMSYLRDNPPTANCANCGRITKQDLMGIAPCYT